MDNCLFLFLFVRYKNWYSFFPPNVRECLQSTLFYECSDRSWWTSPPFSGMMYWFVSLWGIFLILLIKTLLQGVTSGLYCFPLSPFFSSPFVFFFFLTHYIRWTIYQTPRPLTIERAKIILPYSLDATKQIPIPPNGLPMIVKNIHEAIFINGFCCILNPVPSFYEMPKSKLLYSPCHFGRHIIDEVYFFLLQHRRPTQNLNPPPSW